MILNGFEIMKPGAPLSHEINSDKVMGKRTKKPGKLRSPRMVASDGSNVELSKRPRGRPPGSKNRPKPAVFVTASAEPSPAMHPYVLEIPGGLDIVACLARFSKQRKLGICVLAATGFVANVTLRQPAPPQATANAAAIVFHGRFAVLSISATFLPPAMAAELPLAAPVGISISFAGLQGQIAGGIVLGPLMAAGAVVLVVAAFAELKFHKLPVDDEVSNSLSASDGEENCEKQSDGKEQQQHYFHQLHQRQSNSAAPAVELGGMAIYGSNISSDVIFAGGSQLPPPPPY